MGGETTLLVPVANLGVSAPWTVGHVTFHPGANAHALVADVPAREGDFWTKEIERILDKAGSGSIAEVTRPVDDDADAIDEVRASLDALRVFHLSRRVTHTSTFGLAGDHFSAMLEYVSIAET